MKRERADTDGEHDQGTDGTSSHSKSIADHAKAHPHAGHDGTQANPHSQSSQKPQPGGDTKS